jgi:hypothetical protein
VSMNPPLSSYGSESPFICFFSIGMRRAAGLEKSSPNLTKSECV